MNEKTEKLSAKLANVRKNAEDSRRLIAYHKKMLKIYKRKAKELSERLEKEQLNDLYKTMRDGGCDLAALNEAIRSGEFSPEPVKENMAATEKDNASEEIEEAETERTKI